eukprot:Partr_v1_DN27632_c1_g2_i1_m65518 putative protein kinase kinase kinase
MLTENSLSADGAITESDLRTASSETSFSSSMANAMAIPAYLQFCEGDDYRTERKLNAAGSSEVFLVTPFHRNLCQYGSRVVMKRVNLSSSADDPIAIFFQELSITSVLQKCPNIVRLLGYSESPPSIIMKMYPLGSLKTWLKKEFAECPKSQIFSFLQDISNGLKEMHQAGLVHCDIKSDNILVDYDVGTNHNFCVLCDFGITQVVDSKALKVNAFVVANRQGFSLMYAAPEVLISYRKLVSMSHYSCDIYAYGVVVAELMNGGMLSLP